MTDIASFVWLIVSAVVAIFGGFVLYFTFLSAKNDQKFDKFLGGLYNFLSFKRMLIEDFLKIFYLIAAIFITLYSFALIGENFLLFLGTLIVGNLTLRITFELLLVMLLIYRNTTNISNRVTNLDRHFSDEKPADDKPISE